MDESKHVHEHDLCKNDFPHEHIVEWESQEQGSSALLEIKQTQQIRVPIHTIPGIDEIVMDEDLPFKVVVEQELREMVHYFSQPKGDADYQQQLKQKECMYKLFRLVQGSDIDTEMLMFIQNTLEKKLRAYLKRIGDTKQTPLQKKVVDYVHIALDHMRQRVIEASMQDDTGNLQMKLLQEAADDEDVATETKEMLPKEAGDGGGGDGSTGGGRKIRFYWKPVQVVQSMSKAAFRSRLAKDEVNDLWDDSERTKLDAIWEMSKIVLFIVLGLAVVALLIPVLIILEAVNVLYVAHDSWGSNAEFSSHVTLAITFVERSVAMTSVALVAYVLFLMCGTRLDLFDGDLMLRRLIVLKIPVLIYIACQALMFMWGIRILWIASATTVRNHCLSGDGFDYCQAQFATTRDYAWSSLLFESLGLVSVMAQCLCYSPGCSCWIPCWPQVGALLSCGRPCNRLHTCSVHKCRKRKGCILCPVKVSYRRDMEGQGLHRLERDILQIKTKLDSLMVKPGWKNNNKLRRKVVSLKRSLRECKILRDEMAIAKASNVLRRWHGGGATCTSYAHPNDICIGSLYLIARDNLKTFKRLLDTMDDDLNDFSHKRKEFMDKIDHQLKTRGRQDKVEALRAKLEDLEAAFTERVEAFKLDRTEVDCPFDPERDQRKPLHNAWKVAAQTALRQQVLPPGFLRHTEMNADGEELVEYEHKQNNYICRTKKEVDAAIGIVLPWGPHWKAGTCRTVFNRVMAKHKAARQIDERDRVEDGHDLYNPYARNVADFIQFTWEKEDGVAKAIRGLLHAIKVEKEKAKDAMQAAAMGTAGETMIV